MNSIETLRLEFEKKLDTTTSTNDLQNLEIEYLGRNGVVNDQMKHLKDVSAEQRKEMGKSLNEFKNFVAQQLSEKKAALLQQEESSQYVDVTLPGRHYPAGSLHMVTLAIDEISRIFEKLGFVRMSYPEVEWEWFSFEALNMPPNHPARDDFETFFVDHKPDEKYGRMVLTPHTSSGQIREMLRVKTPPIRMINIAKTYRPNWDASHVPMFHQFEGLCIDTNINITNLKGTLDYFAKTFFGETRKTRLRPFHFQFTEPSFEVDISCGVCDGTGQVNGTKCKVCKSGWLELGGAGMVHPNVLKSGGIDPEKYSGFAFGWGVERTFMMKEGLKLDDIRTVYNGDIRFLEQF